MTTRTLPRNFHSEEYGGVSAPAAWVLMPAYTVLPFLRSPLGIGLVHPWTVLRRTALMFIGAVIVGAIFSRTPNIVAQTLVWFALAYCILALAIFVRRWSRRRTGEELHSAEAGYGWLTQRTTLPVPLCEQAIMPLAVIGLGYLTDHTVSVALGGWWMIAGGSLFIMARWEHRRLWSQHQATVDDLIRAKSYEERLSRHEAQQGVAPGATTHGPVFADLGEDH